MLEQDLAPKLPNLVEEQERQVYYFQLFPNILISAHPDYVMTSRLQPLAPDRTRIECE
jgi:Rieske 2Fe-2S family protein